MRRRATNKDDLIARHQPPHTVNNRGFADRPARHGFIINALQFFFRHAGVMFQRHGGHGLTLMTIADKAGEGHHRAGDVAVGRLA